jgi:hypothetical protein
MGMTEAEPGVDALSALRKRAGFHAVMSLVDKFIAVLRVLGWFGASSAAALTTAS